MHSLRSWADAGLLARVSETLIFLQDIDETDFTSIPRELELGEEGGGEGVGDGVVSR